MKKVLLLLVLWGSALQLSLAQGYCNNQSFLSVLSTSQGSPLDGPYKPCEEVLFCYNVIDFNSQGCNWLHGIVPDFGDCWDESSFSPFFAGLPNDLLTFPTNNSGNGEWLWYEDGEITYNNISPAAYPPGGSVGAGWFYNNYVVGPSGTNAGDTWGDGFSCNSQGLTWSFCFNMVTECEPDCNVNGGLVNCTLSIKTFSDGETGGRNQADCVFDQATALNFDVTCCEKPVLELPQTYTICSGEDLIIDLPSSNPDISYYWNVENLSNVGGAGNGGGIRIEQTLTNDSGSPQIVRYTITPMNGAGGCSGDPVVVEVIVQPAIVVTVIGPDLACNNFCVNLYADVAGNGTYSYEWSDGTITDNGIYNDCSGIVQDTEYFVTVTDQNTGCTSLGSLYVPLAPYVHLYAGPDMEITCGETSVTLQVENAFDYTWFAWAFNGVQISNEESIEVTEAGTYFLIANDFYGCIYDDEVIVTQSQSLTGVNAGADTYLPCGATNIGLDASNSPQGTAFVHEWSTTDGTILFDGTTLFPIVEAGTYYLTTTNTLTGCSGVDEVTVFPSIAGIVTQGAALDCNTTSVILDGSASSSQIGIVYQWTTTDGNILNGANTTMAEVDAPGTYTLQVTDTLQNCSAMTDIEVIDNAIAPLADGGGNQSINCVVSMPTLDASGSASGPGITVEWTTPSGNTFNELSITVGEVGTYTLLVTNANNGCTATDVVEVSVDLTPPVAQAASFAPLNCLNGPTIMLDGTASSSGSNITYEWQGPAGAVIENGNTSTPTVDMMGQYSLIVTDINNGCTATDFTIVDDLYLIGLIVTEVNCEAGDGTATVTLAGVNDPVYNWSNGETGAMVDGLAPGDYSVTISGENGTCEEVRDFTVESDLSCKVIIGGYAYADFIVNNCELDNLEEGLQGLVVNLEPLGISTETDANGYYEFEVNTGDYTIAIEEQAPYILQCPVDGMIDVSLQDTSDVSLDNNFYFQVISDFDLIVSANSGTVQPGEFQNYSINYCNFGIQTINGIVRFTHDPQMIFDPIASGASSYDPETYTATWNFNDLFFLSCKSINFKMQAPNDLPVGSNIVSSVLVTPTIGDLNPANNAKTWTRTVQGATDPLFIGHDPIQTKAKEYSNLLSFPNFPNPFDQETTLAFGLPKSDWVQVTIFDLSGKVLQEKRAAFSAGYHEVSIKAADLPSQGMLIYKIETSTESVIGKMVKL